MIPAKIPAEDGLFGADPEICGLEGLDGGGDHLD